GKARPALPVAVAGSAVAATRRRAYVVGSAAALLVGTRRSLSADPPRAGRDRRDPRLPALQPRPALVPALRAVRADPAPRAVDRPEELRLGAARPGLLAHAAAHGGLHRGECRADDGARHADRPPAHEGERLGARPPDLGARAR